MNAFDGDDDEGVSFKSDALTERIIGGIIRVHAALGPGFVESIYRKALTIDLTRAGLGVQPEKEVDIFYLDERVGWHRMDLVIENKVVLELKTVERLALVHYAQLRSCLKASKLEIGLLVNVAATRADYRRVHVR